jgi:hypothetical protein
MTEREMTKLAREKGAECRSDVEEQWHAMQQPTNNGSGSSKGSKGVARDGRSTEKEQRHAMQ